MTLSNINRKEVGDRIHPCLTPFLTSIKSESFPSWEILHLNPTYNILIICIIFLGIPYCCMVSHIISLFMESNTFSKSIKVTYRMTCHSIVCSKIILKVSSQCNFGVCWIQLVLFGGVVPLYFVFFLKWF